jgi:hypothetical protein
MPSLEMIAIPIRYKRVDRAIFFQKLQHALPSIVVLSDGLNHLSHEPSGVDLMLGVLEVGAATAVMGSVVYGFLNRERKGHPRHDHAHHGPDWIDIFIGAMLAVEAYAKFHDSGHWPRPTLLLSAAMFTIGALHGKLAAFGDYRRSLRIDAEQISVPGRRGIARMTLPWAEVAAIEVDDRDAVVTAIDGRSQKIHLHDIKQPDAVREALLQARATLEDARAAQRARALAAAP